MIVLICSACDGWSIVLDSFCCVYMSLSFVTCVLCSVMWHHFNAGFGGKSAGLLHRHRNRAPFYKNKSLVSEFRENRWWKEGKNEWTSCSSSGGRREGRTQQGWWEIKSNEHWKYQWKQPVSTTTSSLFCLNYTNLWILISWHTLPVNSKACNFLLVVIFQTELCFLTCIYFVVSNL